MLISAAIYLAVGAVGGFLAGMLGVGGGILIVPMLGYVFLQQGYSAESIMHLAVGTSMATITITSLSALRAHHRRGSVVWPLFRKITPWLALGAIAGGLSAGHFSTKQLLTLLAVLEVIVAVQLILNVTPAPKPRSLGAGEAAVAGAAIGGVSTMAGVGGGVLLVPLFLFLSVPMRQAVGTSSACGFPISLIGTLVFLSYGFTSDAGEAGSVGYVHIPAFLGIAVASVVTAPLGVAAAHRLPLPWLRRIFAVFLLALAMRMLW